MSELPTPEQECVAEVYQKMREQVTEALQELTDEQLKELEKLFSYHLHELIFASNRFGYKLAMALQPALRPVRLADIEIYTQNTRRKQANGTLFGEKK